MATDDTDARRRELLAKRDRLRAEQSARMEQRSRDADIARFAEILGDFLTAEGIAHEVVWPWDAPPPGPIGRYPIGFASIHWDLVPEHAWDFGGDTPERAQALVRALAALGIDGHRRVAVEWYCGGLPRVLLRAADLATHARELLAPSHDTWVFDADADWIIECYHEGDVRHAARPGLPEHAGDRWRTPPGRT